MSGGTPIEEAISADVAAAQVEVAALRAEADVAQAAAESTSVKPAPPVYDERGNVRPRGTPGAKPMSLSQRKAIARRLADGARIVTTAEKEQNPT